MKTRITLSLLKKVVYLLPAVILLGSQVKAQRPVITSFSPLSAAPGSSVTLTGANFNPTASNNIMYFGAARAIVTGATSSSLTVTVPAGASYGAITVLNAVSGLTGASRQYFIPLPNRSRATALTAADFIDNGSTAAAPRDLYNLATSDLDNDGKPDLVATSPLSFNPIYIYKNTSTASSISFAGAISHATGSVSTQMVPVIGDLNGDGRPDIVVAGFDSSNFTAMQNTGDLSAFTTSTVATGAEPMAAGMGDFDSDGKLDVVIGHDFGTGISVYRNDGTSGGAISFESPLVVSAAAANRIIVADLNGDDKPDILIGKGTGVTVLENTTASGVISFTQSSLVSPTIHSLTIGDLDNDGKLDLITTFPNSGTDITVFRNTSAGTISFTSQTVTVGDPQLDVSLGDLNGDGRLDLFIGINRDYGSNEYRTTVLTNTSSPGNISFGSGFQLPAGRTPRSTITADMNGDGLADLLSLSSNLRSVRIHRNALQYPPIVTAITPEKAAPGTSITLTGSGFNSTAANNVVYFGQVKAAVTAATGTSLTVTVPVNASYGAISVLNTANGLSAYSRKFFTPVFSPGRPSALTAGDFTLVNHITAETDSELTGILSGDLDNDGKPELVLTTSKPGTNTVYIRKNTSTTTTISFNTAVSNVATGADRLGHPAMGDIDGDGRLDIVVPGYDSNNFVVMRNTGTLSGFVSTAFAAGTNAAGSALGDIDGDGKIDVVIANYGNSTISVFKNTSTPGSISFAAAVNFSTSSSVDQLVVADFNGDNKPDILASRGTNDRIRVFENTTTGSTINFSTSDIVVIQHPSGLTAGDLDNDGDLDVVVASSNNADTKLAILTNTSTTGITFSVQQIDVGSPQDNSALADLNADGKLDLVLATRKDFGSFTYRMAVLTNTTGSGAISFSSQVNLPADRFPLSILATDMNGDHQPDLIGGNFNVARISIYRNTLQYPPAITSFSPAKAAPGASITLTGSGFSTTMANNIVYFGPVKGTVSAATASSLTVTVPFGATHSLISVLNTGTGMSGLSLSKFLPVFTPNKQLLRAADIAARATITTVFGPYTVTSADFDGDGKTDLLTNSSNNTVSIHPNTGSSGTISFGTATTLTSNNSARYTGIGDIDGDGKLDIAVPNLNSDNVSIFRNSGSGTISFDPKVDIAAGNGPVACAFADLDGDGRPELIVSNYNEDKISVFRNTTSGVTISFDPKVDFTVGLGPAALLVNDFDGDSKLDLAVSLSNAGKIVVLRSTGSGSIAFAAPFEVAVGTTPWMMQSADIDSDGKPDIAVPILSEDKVTVFRNNSTSGAASFLTGIDYPVGSTPRALSFGDVNGDGRPDMVVANEGANTLSLFANSSSSGTINFASAIALSVSSGGPRDVMLADLDGDGRSDIASADGNTTTVSIFRNALVAAPTVQASNISFSSTTATSTTINWTSGNGASRVVWMKAANTGVPAPVDENTYTANAAFGSVTELATGWYAVYSGTGSSVGVTGLTAATDYQVMVTEYNGTAGLELYQRAAATNNPVLLTTPSADATLSALTLSSGSLSPGFASGTLAYSATVSPATASMTVTATANQGNATLEVRVNGGTYTAVVSGAASSALALNNGSNTIDVKVTAQDGTTVKTYTITVIRQINQTITFAGTAGVTYGTADFDPGASSDNTGIPVTYASSDPAIATIVSGKVHILKAGAVTITASQAGDATYVAATDKAQTLTISPKAVALSLNASPTITKTYDGTTGVALAAANYTLTGIETGDAVTVSGTAGFDTKNAGTGKTVTATGFTLAGAQKDNYTLTTVSATTAGSITAKSITLSLNASPAITKTYDGTTTAMLAAGNYVLNGIETGDAVTVSGTAGFDTKNAGTGKTVTLPLSSLSLSGAQAANYTLANTLDLTAAIGTISPRPLTVTANNFSKVYDGMSYSGGNGVSYTGFALGEDASLLSGSLAFGGSSQGATGVGSYPIVPSGLSSPNYVISYAPGQLTISLNNVNTLSFTAQTPGATISRTYGDADINAAAVASSGLAASYQSSNTAVAAVSASGQVSLVGTGTATITVSQAGDTNYGPASPISFTVQVDKKTLVVTANDLSRTYNGLPYSGGNGVSYSGFVNNEGPAVLSGSLSYGGSSQGAVNTGVYTLVPSGLTAANYNLDYRNGTLSVVQAGSNVLTFNSQVAGSTVLRTYGDGGGSAAATASSGLAASYQSSNPAVASVDASGTILILSAGTATITASQAGNINYPAAAPVSFTLTVQKKALTVTANNAVREYNGQANTTGNGLSYTGFIAGEDEQNLQGTLSYSGTAIGAKDVGSYFISPGGYSSANYAISYQDGSLTITKASVAVRATAQSKTYGDTDPALSYTSTGLIGSDTFSGSLQRTAGEDAGSYLIGPGTLSAGANYTLLYTPAELIIGKAPLTITAQAAAMCQGSALPAFTVTYSGFKRGDSESSLTARPVVGTSATSASPAGTYTLSPAGAASGNYTFAYLNSTLTVNALPTASISSDKGNSVSKGETVVLSAPAGAATYSWSGPGILSGQNSASISVRHPAGAVYTVTLTTAAGCSRSASFTLSVREDFQAIGAKNVITPNGDGFNDTWVIDNIDFYPNNTVTVFDRNSKVVYTKRGYDNSWDGTYNGNVLPQGTYYFIIDYGASKGTHKGFITLVR